MIEYTYNARMNTLADRLKTALEHKEGLNKTGLWKACNLSSGAISQWFSGSTKELKGENLLNAAKYLGVNPNWLASGHGEMLPKNHERRQDKSFTVGGIKMETSDVHLVRMYLKLSHDSQNTIDLLVNRLYQLEHPNDKLANPVNKTVKEQ